MGCGLPGACGLHGDGLGAVVVAPISDRLRRRKVKMLSGVTGVTDAKAEADAIAADSAAHAAAMGQALAEPGASPTAALSPAQLEVVTSVLDKVSAREIPRETGVTLMVATLGIDAAKADEIMGPIGTSFFTAPPASHADEMAALKGERDALHRSHTSTRAMLQRVLEKNRNGELVTGSPIGNALPTVGPLDG